MNFSELKTNDLHVIDAGVNCKDVIDNISKLESSYVLISSKRRRASRDLLYLYYRKDLLEALKRLQLEHGYNITHVSVNQILSLSKKNLKLFKVIPVNVEVDVNLSEIVRNINAENPRQSTIYARFWKSSRTASARLGKGSRTASVRLGKAGKSISSARLEKPVGQLHL